MFLARIDGTLTSTRRHGTFEAVRFLIARRMDANGCMSGEPLVVLDRMGAGPGTIALVSSDGKLARDWLGPAVPARFTVVGLVDRVHLPGRACGGPS
ncbi:MAG TPA: EutN/CcmL family microcompartment protein [Vicinamibacterales bacterium]|nr:EutN/CcmL family microcompartment protein [Vicinamibacterales bacterium]HOG28232.1 EutN/CcmL family microcompartment protein [Vicinamibacterales bacterium]HPK71477.1 EutN/CcmL family microcompartment protein [Vicinamibacterales bacterium]HPW21577.1 EutN/CcmL family microcompartment protein [Vicinamibacterales bacterium]